MKQECGWWLPDHEKHLPTWMRQVNDKQEGRLRYQGTKLDVAMSLVKDWDVAIDIGAHVGLMAYWLAKKFGKVIAFEPVAAHRECFVKNVAAHNVELHGVALGDAEGMVAIATTLGSSGDSHVRGTGDIPMHRLDDLLPEAKVGFIKIDTEGHEEPILRGAKQLILRSKPVLMVEQKGHEEKHFGFEKEGAIRLLRSWGAEPLCKPMSGDWIMGWKP